MIGQLFHFGRIGAARVQHAAAASVDDARVFPIQRDEVVRLAGWIIEIQVREGLPTTAETDDLDVVLTAAIGHSLMIALTPGTSPPPVRMPIRFLAMPASQDSHILITPASRCRFARASAFRNRRD